MDLADDNELLAIYRESGFGTRLARAARRYAKEYVYSPDEGSDHEPTEFEQLLFEDLIEGLFVDEEFAGILQEAARGMKAGGVDPEGPDTDARPPVTRD